MAKQKDLRAQIKDLPNQPGVYLFKNASGKVIYAGKAKDLRKRVSAYFGKEQTGKTAVLVKNIYAVEHVVTSNETEAFLLENILIKKYQPRYNILLKDDKTYPWIVIRNESFPRVEMTRDWKNDGSEYFGPYTSVKTVKILLELIHDLFPLRTCRLDLSPEKIAEGRYQVCLEYHMRRCKAPCTGEESLENYSQYIEAIRKILRGHFKPVSEYLHKKMLEAAERLEFEKAHAYRQKLLALENYQSRSTVVNPKLGNLEVYSIVTEGPVAYVNFMEIANGTVIRAQNLELRSPIEEKPAGILATAIVEVRQKYPLRAREIIVPFPVNIPYPVKQTVPQRGDKKKLLELSEKNARYFRLEKLKNLQRTDPEEALQRRLKQLQKDLRLPKPPIHMECFDISHTQGVEKTASCVVFRNLKPDKTAYRHFRIKTVEGNNDFASMYETVYRRYNRLLQENAPLPDLVVIDGGKGQLNMALKALKTLGLDNKISLIAIAKKLEEIYRPGDPVPLYLDKTSETLRIIQQIRNEAHRFGLRLHRKRRTKRSVHSALTEIPGIGEKTAVKLLKHFKSLKRIKESDIKELEKVAGKKLAEKLKTHLNASS